MRVQWSKVVYAFWDNECSGLNLIFHIDSEIWLFQYFDYSDLTIQVWFIGWSLWLLMFMKGCIDDAWSSVKIDETWSTVVLRVEAFNMEVEASCQ